MTLNGVMAVISFIHLFVQRHRYIGQYKTKNMNSKQDSPGSGNKLLQWPLKIHKIKFCIILQYFTEIGIFGANYARVVEVTSIICDKSVA